MRYFTFLLVLLIIIPFFDSEAYTIGDGDWTYKPEPMGEDLLINPNCSDSGCGSPADQINAIWMAAKAWSDYGNAGFEFSYGGLTATARPANDDKNIIYFSQSASGSTISAAYTWITYDMVTECDLVFYDSLWLFNAKGRAEHYEYDVWSLAANELGHVLVLGASEYDEATMYSNFRPGEMFKRTLHWDDIAGIQAIYGERIPFSIVMEPAEDASYARIFDGAGGELDFTVRVYNNSDTLGHFQATIDLIKPNGQVFGPLFHRDDVSINGGDSIVFNSTQLIPPGVPPNEYLYRARIRDANFPYDDYDISNFHVWITDSGQGSIVSMPKWQSPRVTFNSSSSGNLNSDRNSQSSAIISYPNPFNDHTKIIVELDESAKADVRIFNLLGEEVECLIENRILPAGDHFLSWHAKNPRGDSYPTGMYFLKVTLDGKVFTQRLMLLK
ncbi:MAG: T9SS type A sorting domain-containing protein [candidate division Zixibacteria bacterium]|nr:T9SS type A sorting domain-containing protein [candidate division Zixibacteria bacterium]